MDSLDRRLGYGGAAIGAIAFVAGWAPHLAGRGVAVAMAIGVGSAALMAVATRIGNRYLLAAACFLLGSAPWPSVLFVLLVPYMALFGFELIRASRQARRLGLARAGGGRTRAKSEPRPRGGSGGARRKTTTPPAGPSASKRYTPPKAGQPKGSRKAG
ncbi:MAG: hypothetical protein ACYDH5_14770 [Acidimicrobiales bacterium]